MQQRNAHPQVTAWTSVTTSTVIIQLGRFARLRTGTRFCRPCMAALKDNYSLWLKPSGPVATKLAKEIQAQSAAYGGPLFEPHVTLLPDIPTDKAEAMAKSQQLAEKLHVSQLHA